SQEGGGAPGYDAARTDHRGFAAGPCRAQTHRRVPAAQGHVSGQGPPARHGRSILGAHPRDGVRKARRMIAVDTNILVYAHREDSQWHDAACALVAELAEGRAPWAIPWPCLHEFLAIVTHPRIYAPPTPLAAAMDQ